MNYKYFQILLKHLLKVPHISKIMRSWALLLTILCLIITQLQKDALVFARRRRPPALRRIKNSRTRFQQRINRLGPRKIDLIRSGRMGKSRGLPSGFVLIGGQVIDSSNKVIQRMVQGGTAYYSFQDKLGRRPLYIRPGNEVGWHFVVFQDPFYWRGSGHLILLRKVLGININKSQFQRDTMYEAFTLSLRVSMHPRVHIRDPAFRHKLMKRKRRFRKVLMKRGKYNVAPVVAHLRDRKGRLGKRKKRSVSTFNVASLLQSRGDCALRWLNTTRIFLRMQNNHSEFNSSVSEKYHKYTRPTPIHTL